MVTPTAVINKIIELINQNLDLFPKGMTIREGSEDLNESMNLLNIVVYADFDEKAEISATGSPIEIPCSIYIQCTSGSFPSPADSFNQALIMIMASIKIICDNNYYDIENHSGELETVVLNAQDIPIIILRKSAEASTLTACFTYNITGF